MPDAVDSGMGKRIRNGHLGARDGVLLADHEFRIVRQGRAGHEGRGVLRVGNILRTLFDVALDGIAALEVVSEYAVDESKTNEVRGLSGRIRGDHRGGAGGGERV